MRNRNHTVVKQRKFKIIIISFNKIITIRSKKILYGTLRLRKVLKKD